MGCWLKPGYIAKISAATVARRRRVGHNRRSSHHSANTLSQRHSNAYSCQARVDSPNRENEAAYSQPEKGREGS